ncbi:MAG TPA: amidophosphoribosyltransferase [Thermoanaerobaculia bacterium]|nr:amidophosphoribosyltransferase [Thermoanaerobaculia bacterium]
MCGIFGIDGSTDAANLTYLGLYALQHRGQESAGIVSWDGARLHVERGMGHVADIFRASTLKRLPGTRSIGHTRYSTSGQSVIHNAQPIVVKTSMGPLGIVHNGNLVNAGDIRARLEREGSIFQTTSDTEVILHLMARNPRATVVESLMEALVELRGAYSLLLISDQGLYAARDPHGFRPLQLGEHQNGLCFASESCAFDLMEARTLRELEAGEVVVARGGALESYRLPVAATPSRCAFEHVYFARPDSIVFGDAVASVRQEMGAQLAREAPAAADVVVPVPDSGVVGALGYSRESGLPFDMGLIRNHYVGRTFIEPQQSIRHFGVRVKLNPVRSVIEGRKVVLVDDSIIRGTTSRKIVRMVRDAGAREVHVRLTSPPTRWPCRYGIDTPTREELIASTHDPEEIRRYVEADSLAYLSLEGMLRCLSGPASSYCTACWSGEYPAPVDPDQGLQAELFPIRMDRSE